VTEFRLVLAEDELRRVRYLLVYFKDQTQSVCMAISRGGYTFTVAILNLPTGKYTIVIGEVETLLSKPGERSFVVTCGDEVLAANFDIVAGVMTAYNALAGVPCSAINDIWNRRSHQYVAIPEEAAAVTVKAGCNLCCGGDYNALVKAVQKGLISEK